MGRSGRVEEEKLKSGNAEKLTLRNQESRLMKLTQLRSFGNGTLKFRALKRGNEVWPFQTFGL
jgi:hypothetical protein